MILKFYSFEFDEKAQGIDLLNAQQIFYDKLSLKATKSVDTQEQELKAPDLTQSKSTPAFSQADL